MVSFQAEHVDVSIGGTPILNDLSLTIDRGTFVGILGPNGSGKTTLLRALAGLQDYRGALRLDGRSIRSWSARDLARRLAFVRQTTFLTFDFTVEELVLLGRLPHKRWLEAYSSKDHEYVRDALEKVDLSNLRSRSALSLSGGELQRVMLAQALVQETDYLLLDEPTAHLDVHYQFELMHDIRKMVKDGKTTIAVFHDLEMASRYADQVVVLQKGSLAGIGKPADVLNEELIRTVYRMDSRIERQENGRLSIRFVAPYPGPNRN